MNNVILAPKNSIYDLKNVISGEISAEKIFWKNFIAPKDSFLNLRGSLELFFRRYQHFIGFWHSSASLFRGC